MKKYFNPELIAPLVLILITILGGLWGLSSQLGEIKANQDALSNTQAHLVVNQQDHDHGYNVRLAAVETDVEFIKKNYLTLQHWRHNNDMAWVAIHGARMRIDALEKNTSTTDGKLTMMLTDNKKYCYN